MVEWIGKANQKVAKLSADKLYLYLLYVETFYSVECIAKRSQMKIYLLNWCNCIGFPQILVSYFVLFRLDFKEFCLMIHGENENKS